MKRWSPIPGYEGRYRIYDDGRVTGNKGGKWSVVSPTYPGHGYPIVYLRIPSASFSVHRLVALAFVPGFKDDLLVRHLDGNQRNPNWENLAWGTHQDNEDDKRRHGRVVRGDAHPKSVLSEMLVRVIRRCNCTDKELAPILGVWRAAIRLARIRETWRHVP